MLKDARFPVSFRARLMLLLSSFLLLTIGLVVALDKWAQKRTDEEVARQNELVEEAVKTGYSDITDAFSQAVQNLSREQYLYQVMPQEKLPSTVEYILITDEKGKVVDATTETLLGRKMDVPGEPVKQEVSLDPVAEEPDHEHKPKTYYQPVTTAKGLYWIIIVTAQHSIINRIEDASQALVQKKRDLSNYRIAVTGGLLGLALAIAVVIGWRFTYPIKELASAARRVAEADLDFKVDIHRQDEIGQLAATFNEMIDGLKAKRELEEKLNQAERAAVIGRLTQSIAHEIRNPLNVLNLSIDHVNSKFSPEDPDKRKQFSKLLSSVKDEIARLKRLVSDVLNYGRPSTSAPETVDMTRLVEETMALIRPQADEQGVVVTMEESSPAALRGDSERLKSCISNIAINALQAMPTGGHLNASVRRNDGLIEVRITDTGPGITEEAVHKIFEPYYSTKQTGFGLGLAVTKKIIEEHHGSIDVRSESEHGATFILRLPAADGTTPGGSKDGKEPGAGR